MAAGAAHCRRPELEMLFELVAQVGLEIELTYTVHTFIYTVYRAHIHCPTPRVGGRCLVVTAYINNALLPEEPVPRFHIFKFTYTYCINISLKLNMKIKKGPAGWTR